jgi:hypothetical protein
MRLLVIALAALVLVPVAHADGLPVLGIDVGSSGVIAPGGTVRYVTVSTGKTTTVEGILRNGGQIVRQVTWPGTFTIPAVAYDRTPGGLSGDRRTLVLIEPRQSFPRKKTRLLVLRARTLTHAGLIDLEGDFSFDAVSPDGSRIYLIQYTSPIDPTRYLVRAYDVKAHRLLTRPVVDPRDATEKMRGNPLSRAASVDGRWAYTLYDGGGVRPFVHALDTKRSVARCIDIGGLLPGTNEWSLRLAMSPDGKTVAVRDGATTLFSLDTRTLAAAQQSPSSRHVWPFVVVAALLLLAGIALTRRLAPALRAPKRVEPAAVLLRRPRT